MPGGRVAIGVVASVVACMEPDRILLAEGDANVKRRVPLTWASRPTLPTTTVACEDVSSPLPAPHGQSIIEARLCDSGRTSILAQWRINGGERSERVDVFDVAGGKWFSLGAWEAHPAYRMESRSRHRLALPGAPESVLVELALRGEREDLVATRRVEVSLAAIGRVVIGGLRRDVVAQPRGGGALDVSPAHLRLFADLDGDGETTTIVGGHEDISGGAAFICGGSAWTAAVVDERGVLAVEFQEATGAIAARRNTRDDWEPPGAPVAPPRATFRALSMAFGECHPRDHETRVWLVRAIGAVGTPEAFAWLADLHRSADGTSLAEAVVSSLANPRWREQTTPLLHRALQSADQRVVCAALRGLHTIDSPERATIYESYVRGEKVTAPCDPRFGTRGFQGVAACGLVLCGGEEQRDLVLLRATRPAALRSSELSMDELAAVHAAFLSVDDHIRASTLEDAHAASGPQGLHPWAILAKSLRRDERGRTLSLHEYLAAPARWDSTHVVAHPAAISVGSRSFLRVHWPGSRLLAHARSSWGDPAMTGSVLELAGWHRGMPLDYPAERAAAIDGPVAAAQRRDALLSKHPLIRVAAARSVRLAGDRDALPALMRAVASETYVCVAEEMFSSIGALGGPEHARQLAGYADRGRPWRDFAIDALTSCAPGSPEALTVTRAALRSDELPIQTAGLRAASRIRHPDVAALTSAALRHARWEIRLAAVDSIPLDYGPGLTAAAAALAAEPHPRVAARFAQRLRDAFGQEFGTDLAAWLRWLQDPALPHERLSDPPPAFRRLRSSTDVAVDAAFRDASCVAVVVDTRVPNVCRHPESISSNCCAMRNSAPAVVSRIPSHVLVDFARTRSDERSLFGAPVRLSAERREQAIAYLDDSLCRFEGPRTFSFASLDSALADSRVDTVVWVSLLGETGVDNLLPEEFVARCARAARARGVRIHCASVLEDCSVDRHLAASTGGEMLVVGDDGFGAVFPGSYFRR